MKFGFPRFVIFLTALSSTSFAGQTSRGIGSGLAFAPTSYSTVLNPASVASAPQAAIAGSYRPEDANPFVSFVGSTGSVGIGAAYRQEGKKDVAGQKSNRKDIVEAVFGTQVMFLTLGGTYRKVENQNSNYDLAVMADLAMIRMGAVLRSLKDGPLRADYFIGAKLSSIHVEVNAKKQKPLSQKSWLMDFGIAYVSADMSIGFGYDAPYNGEELEDGKYHGGASFRLLGNLFVEGMYRPFAHEWSETEWLAGARLVF
jgi:hypothetical protein